MYVNHAGMLMLKYSDNQPVWAWWSESSVDQVIDSLIDVFYAEITLHNKMIRDETTSMDYASKRT